MNTMEKLKDFIRTLKSNSLEFVKQQDLLPYISGIENEVWKFSPLEYKHLHKIWVSRWLGMFLAGNLINAARELPDKEFLESSSFFIKNSTFLIDNKILRSVNLNNISLVDANLSDANLSDANLSDASFLDTDLSYADLSGAYLPNAYLLDTDLAHADLSRATLHHIIIRPKGYEPKRYEGLKCKEADFNLALIEDKELAQYLHEVGGKNVPK
jgi:hypothetical protein